MLARRLRVKAHCEFLAELADVWCLLSPLVSQIHFLLRKIVLMEQLPISAIHPNAPEIIAAVALYSAPIDVEAAVERIGQLWAEDVQARWVTVDGDEDSGSPAGKILTFTIQGVQVLLTPVNDILVLGRGTLPPHSFHVAMSFYAPLPLWKDGKIAQEVETSGPYATELMLRHRMLSAHIVYTEVADAFLREEAAIGVYRDELGVVHPPEMVKTLADLLTDGQVPLPLWVNIRLGDGDTNRGRTLGLPAFGHVDVEIVESVRPLEDIYRVLASVANYVISSDTYLLPGQTLGLSETESFEISQDISDADGATVMRLDY